MDSATTGEGQYVFLNFRRSSGDDTSFADWEEVIYLAMQIGHIASTIGLSQWLQEGLGTAQWP